MVWKWPHVSDLGEVSSHLLLRSLGRQSLSNTVGLLRRWSWKTCSSVKPLHISSGLLGDRASNCSSHILSFESVEFCLEAGLEKAIYQWHSRNLCSFIQISWVTELWVKDSFTGKMVLKRPHIGVLGEALALHIHCSGFQETELWAIVWEDRALRWYHSFSGKMVLKEVFVTLEKHLWMIIVQVS